MAYSSERVRGSEAVACWISYVYIFSVLDKTGMGVIVNE
jgi:hypothetical protein